MSRPQWTAHLAGDGGGSYVFPADGAQPGVCPEHHYLPVREAETLCGKTHDFRFYLK